jgi:hypothetical protein
MTVMCRECLVLIAKADDDEYLDSLDLRNVDRKTLETLYKAGEDAIAELLKLQGTELDAAIQELSDELAADPDELLKVILQVQNGETFQKVFEDTLHAAFRPLFDLAGESEAIAVNEDAKWKIENKAAAAFTKKLSKLVPSLNETVQSQLLTAFEGAIMEGKTPAERATLVKEISRQAADGEEGPFSMTRAVRISRTLTTAAANGGKVEGWKQSGVVQGKRWRSANNKRTRKSHRRADGQVRPLDKPFKVGKSELMYPGDPSGPAAEIIHCRCTMQAVFDHLDNYPDKPLEEHVRDDILAGEYPLKIKKSKQDEHIEGTKAYANRLKTKPDATPPSLLTVDAQELVNKYAGSGKIMLRGGTDDNPPKEKIRADYVVGLYYNPATGQYEETRAAMIIYSTRGTHVYPAFDEER